MCVCAGQAGIAQAQFNIGVAFDKGKVVQPSAETAVHWYGLASKQDLAEAQVGQHRAYASVCSRSNDRSIFISPISHRDASRMPHPPLVQCNLGVCHEAGKGGMVPNMSLAVSLYRISADQGRNACACCNLGMCFLKGVEVVKDSVEGALWIGRAATLGNVEAQLATALMHIKGLGLPIDHEQAISWLRQAASQGHATAMTALGLCYQGGIGVLQDTEQAVTLYLDAAGPGPPNRMCERSRNAYGYMRTCAVCASRQEHVRHLPARRRLRPSTPFLPLGSFVRLFRVFCPLTHRSKRTNACALRVSAGTPTRSRRSNGTARLPSSGILERSCA